MQEPLQTPHVSPGGSPTNGGRVQNEVTPQGVWKLMGNKLMCPRTVQNEVTPQGVWKHEPPRPDEGEVHGPKRSHATGRMETPRSQLYRGNRPPVQNEVTPQGVWKLDLVALADRVVNLGSKTKSRHRAYGNEAPRPSAGGARSKTKSRHRRWKQLDRGHRPRSKTKSRHRAYGNRPWKSRHRAYGNPHAARLRIPASRPKRSHATGRMETSRHYFFCECSRARPKRSHATGRMETLEGRTEDLKPDSRPKRSDATRRMEP